MTSGIVFNIQKFSIHDGPGVRTTVFLKGCPLRCAWCANPESQMFRVQVLYDASKCVHCGTCIRTCAYDAVSADDNGRIRIDFGRCQGCLECVRHCPGKALSSEGEERTPEEVFRVCMQDIDFYEESGGGVTLSGGEAMCQPEFTEELVRLLKEKNVHTAVETTGSVAEDVFRRLAVQFDLLLFDVKQADREKHRAGTGVYNDLILKNLRWAVRQGLRILPRIPVIPGFNAELQDAAEIADLLNDIGLSEAQLLPFHQMGERKYEFLNRDYSLKQIRALRPEDLTDYRQVFLDRGIHAYF